MQKEYKKFKMEEGIFTQPKKNVSKIPKDETKDRVVIAYAYDGHKKQKVINENNHLAWAKLVSINGRDRYYVKVCKMGNNVGMLPNPKSDTFTANETSSKIGGIETYSWHNVKKQLFTEYLNFLITGETKWVRAAQSRLQS